MRKRTRARMISFMSAKGGVGKTSIAVNVANFCACYQMKVLLVDCDLQTKGATFFMRISKIHSEENSFITFDRIVEDIVKKDSSITDSKKEKGPVPILQNLAFIPAARQNFDFTKTVLFYNSGLNNESNCNSNSTDSLDFGCYEKSFREIFVAYQEKYELILFDLGAGGGVLNEIISLMSDCICVIAEDNKVSLMSVRELKGELWDRHRLEKIVPCYNKIIEENKDNLYNKDFWSDPIRGFEYMDDYAKLFNQGELLNPEENRHAETLMAIIKGLGVDTRKIDAERRRREDEKKQKEEREQKRKERLENLKRKKEEEQQKIQKMEEEKRKEEQRERENRNRQDAERRQEEREKREKREKLIQKECRKMYRWDLVICTGIFFSLLIGIVLFESYRDKVAVWIYALVNLFLIIILIIGFVWLNAFRLKIEEIIKYAGLDTEEREENK